MQETVERVRCDILIEYVETGTALIEEDKGADERVHLADDGILYALTWGRSRMTAEEMYEIEMAENIRGG